MKLATLRPFVIFVSGFLACFVLVSSGGAGEGDAVQDRRYNEAQVAAGQLTPVQGATANVELAKKAEADAEKLHKFGVRSEGDVTQARYFRVQAELELELAKRAAKKK